MKRTQAAALLMVVQVALVLSIAGKYLYERKTRPRVWALAAQYDPNAPLRGRYLAMQLFVDVCGLPHDKTHFTEGYRQPNSKVGPGQYRWRISLDARDGHLVPRLAGDTRFSEGTEDVTQGEDHGCDRVAVNPGIDYFISDTAKAPFPLKRGEELWVEVTVPKSGPPRPVQLALSDSRGFRPLRFE